MATTGGMGVLPRHIISEPVDCYACVVRVAYILLQSVLQASANRGQKYMYSMCSSASCILPPLLYLYSPSPDTKSNKTDGVCLLYFTTTARARDLYLIDDDDAQLVDRFVFKLYRYLLQQYIRSKLLHARFSRLRRIHYCSSRTTL